MEEQACVYPDSISVIKVKLVFLSLSAECKSV